MDSDFRATYPGERAIVLADRRQEWWAGLGASAVILGIATAGWLVLSAPQNASGLADTVVPAADAATLFTGQAAPSLPSNVVLTAADTTAQIALTTDDVIKIQSKLKTLGFDPGKADGKAGPHTLNALNAYRKSLGLQAVATVDRTAVAPLIP